jgi:hypothetical protein
MQIHPNVEYWLRVMSIAVPAISAIVVAVVSYWLSRRMETHKSQLQATLQTKLYEFQTRFSWLHKSRAEAIEKLYAMLARVEGDVNVWITSSHELRNQTEDEHYRAAEGHFQEMINFFDEKRIYFDQETIKAVLVMTQATRTIYDWHPEVQRTSGPAPQLAGWLKQHAAALKEQNIGPLMALLEEKFRKLLEAEAPNYQPGRMIQPDVGPDKKQQSRPGFWRRIGRLLGRRPKDRRNT